MPTQEVKVVFTAEGEILPEQVGDPFIIQANIAAVPASWATAFGDVALDVGQKYDQIESWHDELTGWNVSLDTSVNSAIASILTESSQSLVDIQGAKTTAVSEIELESVDGVLAVQTAATAKVNDINAIIADFGGVNFQGDWNAQSNTPNLGASSPAKGDLYRVSVAGSTDLDGFTGWKVDDWALFDGVSWQRVPSTSGTGIRYQGEWNANTNTPTISSGVGGKGDFYRVAVSGSAVVDGYSSWVAGDWIIFSGAQWQVVPAVASAAVTEYQAQNVTPASPANGQMRSYQKGSYFVIQYNDNGTVRYKYLDMSGTGVTWIHSTVAP